VICYGAVRSPRDPDSVLEGSCVMKKLLVAILISAFMLTGAPLVESQEMLVAYADQKDKKDDKRRKDPPGPPIVRPKGGEKPKDPPRKDKKRD